MARAVGIPQAGGPDVLTVVDRPVREPGPGEVRIAVAAAAVNPTDLLLCSRGGGDVPGPWTPGMDAAGVIESVGAGVSELQVGDEVMAAVLPRRPEGGAQAELIVVPAASAVPIPEGTTIAQAATLPMNGLTARYGLERLALASGETLAVSGGAGLLASYVIALAKQRGLRVIADAAPDDEELVRGYGADEVVPRSDDFAAAVRRIEPDGVAAVFDTAVLRDGALGAIRDGGAIAAIREWEDAALDRGIVLHQVWVREVLQRTDWLHELRELAAAGGPITLRVTGEYPPSEAAEAHRRMDAGGVRGRLLIVF